MTNVFSNWIVSYKEEKVELDCKGGISIIIHDITYTCTNTAAYTVRGSICLESPDLGRFWGGAYIYRRICETLPLARPPLGTSNR